MANDVLDTGEIIKDDAADQALKRDLNDLAKNINVKESSSDRVDALFGKLDSVDVEAKNRALQYALKNSKIMVGNVEKSIAEVAEVFDRAVEQDWSTRKIKLIDWASEDDKQLVEWFLNEKWSSLAYLIQLSSQKASLQASRWYWRSNADWLIDVKDDKVFWNQTRRALSWLKEWIEWDYTKDVESFDVKGLTLQDVLNMRFISSTLKEKIENEAEDETVKWLWSNQNYELKNKYTNNFALKQKWMAVWEEDITSNDNEDAQSEEDPLKGLTQWIEYSEENGELIKRYKTKLDIPTETEAKKEYIGIFEKIMNDSDKKWAFKSLLDLNEGFWHSYKIDIAWLKSLEANLWTSKIDWDYGTFESVDDKDDYLTIKGGKLVEAENDSWHHEPVFEANGTSSRDDYRFDSIEAFIKFISWEEIISASEYVEELAKTWEINGLDVYKNRFTDDLWGQPAEFRSLGGWDRYKTFLSLLALGDKFWSNYKLTINDLRNFIKWMDKDVFDYRSGSSTVFHAEWSKFEVDWTGSFSDDTFESVSDFFTYLERKV